MLLLLLFILIHNSDTFLEHEHATLILKDFRNHRISGQSGIAISTADPFMQDIHEIAKSLLDYSKVVHKPMDFIIINKKLVSNEYQSFEE